MSLDEKKMRQSKFGLYRIMSKLSSQATSDMSDCVGNYYRQTDR